MHQKSGKFISVFVQTEEYAQSDIVYTTLHGTIHGLGVICIVMLWSVRMKHLICLFVVGLLEQYICSYPSFMKFPVILNGRCRYVYIYTADRSILMLYTVNSIDTFKYILYRIHLRVLTGLNGQSLVPHILQCHDLQSHLFLGEFLSGYMLILDVIRTIHTPIYTVVGQIQRREHNYSVAIKILLDLLRQIIYLIYLVRHLTRKKHGCLPVGKPLSELCLLYDTVDKLHIVLVLIRIVQRLTDLAIIYEVLCLHGSHIIHFFVSLLSCILYALPILYTQYYSVVSASVVASLSASPESTGVLMLSISSGIRT